MYASSVLGVNDFKVENIVDPCSSKKVSQIWASLEFISIAPGPYSGFFWKATKQVFVFLISRFFIFAKDKSLLAIPILELLILR